MGVAPSELEKKLKAVGFTNQKGSLIWKSPNDSGIIFQIVPFGVNDRHCSNYGYRLYFNGSIDGALYLYDMALAGFFPEVIGVEYNLTELERTRLGWVFYFKSRTSYIKEDDRGIFRKGNVGIVCVGDNHLNLQIRPKRPKGIVPLKESLVEISRLLEEINPMTLDLFSVAAM
jgi:hypothetical protein